MLPQRRDQKDDGRSFFLILFNFEVFQTQRKKQSGFRLGKIYGAKNLFGAKCKRATCALDNYSPCVLGFRAVGTEGARGGAIALPDFGKYVNPILNSGGGWADYVDYITYCLPRISRLSYGPVFMACILSWGLLPTFSSQQARPSLLKFYAGFQAIENLSGVREMGG